MADRAALAIDAASALSPGARERQEDALALAFPDGTDAGFAVLSDGMGGHAAGDLASRIIVAEVFAELTLNHAGLDTSGSDVPALLRHAVSQADETLSAHAASATARSGMGGTVIAATMSGGILHWISVGDSPLYLFRDLALSRLNADHSMAPQIDLMASRGLLTLEQALHHPERHCLTSALTGGGLGEVDCPEQGFALRHGDVVILASDGLQFLPDPIIEAVLLRSRAEDSRRIARDLMDAIATLEDPAQDNVSIVVLRVTTRPPAEAAIRGGWLSRAGLVVPWRRATASVARSAARHG